MSELLEGFGEPVAQDFDQVFRGELVHTETSAFQKIDVYDHAYFGRILTLDDLVQTTERDEFCYHEMLVHPVLCSRDRVERVLVIGGGDGGTLRHVLMHGPTETVMCEIDEAVVRVSRDHLPSLSGDAFDDPRATLVVDDGSAFVEQHEDAFDAIVVDSTDPVGPAVVLFSTAFYEACRRALRPGGVIVSQTGSPFFQAAEFQRAVQNMSGVFDVVEPLVGFVPTYPGALWSYTTGTMGEPVSATSAADVQTRLERRGITTRFYTPELHAASFALPAFVASLARDARAAPASVPRG